MGGSVASPALALSAVMLIWGSGAWAQSPASATTPGSVPQSSPNPVVSGRQRPPAPPPTRIASPDAATALMINPTHTGAQPNDPLAPPLRRLWQVRLGGAVSYPLIVNGEVFVTVGNVDAYWNSAGGARVVALDANTGATLWSHAVPTTYSLANATYENGRVFVQGFSGQLIAFDAVTGTIAWSDDLSNNGQFYVWDAAPTASNGVVYTAGQASSSSSVLAIDEASGRVLWRIDNLFGSGSSSPAVTATDLYETWACNDYRFSLTTHAAVWRYYQNCSGGGGATPAVLNGRVYDHFADVILNTSDGSVAGHIKTSELPAFDGSTMFELINGTFSAGELRAVDPSGTVLWRFTGDGYLVTPPLVVNHVVYAGSATGILYALNESSGAVITQDWVGAQMREGAERRGIIPTAAMAAGNGLLVVPASDLLSAWTSAPVGTPPVSPPSQSPPLNGYTVTDLGTPDAAWQSHAAALNATTVAGATTYEDAVKGPSNHAVTWSGGTMTDDDSQLPQGAPWGAGFSGINASGALIGDVGTQNGGTQAFMLQSGAFTPITGMTSAKGINATDAIVGDGAANGCGRAMVWQNGTLTDLGTLGGCITSAGGINDSGQVVGEAGTQSFDHAFLWQNGSMHDLGTLGGCSSAATAINASGVVVGKSDTTGNCVVGWQAFEYVGGHMVGLGIPPGSGVSIATGISANGVIVGHGGDFGDHVGFVVRGSGLEVLNNLIDSRFGWNIEDPAAVDDLGRIAGTGFRFGKIRAFLLTPSGAGTTGSRAPTVAGTGVRSASYPPPIPSGDQAVTYQNDVAHTGLQNSDSLRPALSRKWSVDLGGSVSYALIAQGMMYVTVADPPPVTGSPHGAKLYALDQATGATLWAPYELGGSRPWANAAYDSGRVFALNVDGLMRAFDAKTGALLWSRQIPDPAGTTTCGCFASAPTAANGIVYTSGGGVAQVSALSESTGAVVWQQRVLGGDHSSPAVSPDGVYVTYACNQAYDFNPTTGAQVWHYQGSCTGGGGKTPVLNAGKLYARDQPFAANPIIDSQSGTMVGQFVSGTAPVIDGSIGLFFTDYNTLQARDLTTNQVLWTFTEDRPSTAPIVVSGYVYLGTGVGTLYVLDEQTGRQVYYDYLWKGITGPDEQNVSAPLAGLTVGQGLLAVPAGNKLFVYGSSGNPPWPPPNFTPSANTADQSVAYQVNPQHNGDLPGAALVAPLTKSWSVDFGEVVSYPVAAQGLVFVATGLFNDNNHPFTHLYALKQDTGATVWGPVPLELNVGDHWAGLAYDSGRLFSLNSVGWLKAWDAVSGRKLWAMQLPSPYRTVNSPPTAMNGYVYVTAAGNGTGEIFAIDASNGSLHWQQAVTNGQGSSPAVSNTGVYETFQCHQVWDFNPSSGAIIWQHSEGTNCSNGETPVLANAKLYERDYLGTNELFNADTGAVLGSFNADAPPAADGSLVFFVTNAYNNAGTLEARDAASNALAWSFTGDGTLSAAPVVVHGVVYIGSTSGKLYALDGPSGKVLWSDSVGVAMRVSRGYEGGTPWQGMASAQGYFFVAAGNQLVAYRASQTGPSPSPSPSPTPSASPTPAPSPNPMRTVPGSSPNPTRGTNTIPPAPPPCCANFAPVRQLTSRMAVAQFSNADVSGRRSRIAASRLR